MNPNLNQVSRETQPRSTGKKSLSEMDLDELYDLWFWLTEVDKAIETLRSGVLNKVLDEEDIGGAIYYMVVYGSYSRQENGLPECADKFFEMLHEKVVYRIKEVNKEIEKKMS